MEAAVLHLSSGGEVMEASKKAHLILRTPAEAVLGSGFFDRMHVSDRVLYLCALGELREGAANRRLSVRLRVAQAGAQHAGSLYRPFMLELARSGTDGGFVAILRDGADVETLKEELAAALDAVASKDIEKSRILATVSHELRTPLNAIIGFSDLLLHDVCGDMSEARQKDYIALIRQSGQHLLGVVSSVLDVSRVELGGFEITTEPFRFKPIAEAACAMIEVPAREKSLTVSLRVGHPIGELRAGKQAVQQILINLLSNAVKFTPQGGRITIVANRIGSCLHFSVSDTGAGISQQDLPLLGQPFVRIGNGIEPRPEGAGLGLSLVKGLVAALEGSLSIESAPGEGTTVSVSLPVDGPAKRGHDGLEEASARVDEKEAAHGALRKTA